MNTRPLVLSFAAAAALVAAVMLLAVLLPPPEPSLGAAMPRSTQSIVLPASPGIRLSAPHRSPRAHASSGYLHLANCRSALWGANGDDDIGSFMSRTGAIGFDWRSYNRYAADRLAVSFWVLYGPGPFNGTYWAREHWASYFGFCMGSDGNITDKVPDPPSGW